jgi:hypothetical protein
MSSIAERMRLRRGNQTVPQESLQVQTLPAHPPTPSDLIPSTTPKEGLQTRPSLGERSVRLFTILTNELPLLGGNPLIARMMQKMSPMFIKELEKLDQAQLDEMYKGIMVMLGQVYAPDAAAIMLDLKQQHIMVHEVALTMDERVPTEMIAPALQAASDLVGEDFSDDFTLAPPPPALPDVGPQDALVGVEVVIDGVRRVIAVSQSQLAKMREQG